MAANSPKQKDYERDAEWRQSGGTLSDKTARKEFGLTESEIIGAIRAGKLQYRQGSVFGNPFFRLLRSEVESLVKRIHGGSGFKTMKIQTELRQIKTTLNKYHRQIRELEKRQAILQGDLNRVERRCK